MPAAIKHLTVEQGATFRIRLTLKGPDPGDPEVLIPKDITGAEIRMQGRPKKESAVLYFDLDNLLKGGITIEDAPNGVFSVLLTPSQTSEIPKGGEYDIEIDFFGGDTKRLLQGKIDLSKEVTR